MLAKLIRNDVLHDKILSAATVFFMAISAMLSVWDALRLVVGGKEVNYTVCGIYSDITNGGKTEKITNRPDDTPAIWSVLYVSLKKSAVKGLGWSSTGGWEWM